MEKARQIAKTVFHALDDKKAEDIKIIEIGKLSVIADYFIIANGTNTPHVEALVDNVEEELEKLGICAARVEGAKSSGWVLMDYGDVVIHIFSKEDRLFYDLERIWRDGEIVDADTL